MLAATAANLPRVSRIDEIAPVNPSMFTGEAPLPLGWACDEEADRALAWNNLKAV